MKRRSGNLAGLFCVALLATTAAPAADLVWIGGTGAWNLAGNWSPAQVPTAADNVLITNPGIYTITVPAGTVAAAANLAIGGASGTQNLSIDRATFTLGGTGLINAHGILELLVSQSVLTGAGSLIVNGMLSWDNGTLSGTGSASIGSGGTLVIGSGGVTLGRVLNNGGIATWSGGNLNLGAGAILNNLAGATFNVAADGHLIGSAATPINNSGLFRQTGATLGTIISAPFTNSGTLQVLTAPLSLNLGSVHTGIISNAPGASVTFGGGSHVLAPGSLVTGLGVLNVNGSGTTLTAGGVFDASTALNVTAGLATLSSLCNVTGTALSVGGSGAVVNFNSAGTVGAVTLTAGTLGGTSSVIVTGPLTLSGGTVTNALVIANGGLAINGNTALNGARLVNSTNALWSAGNITGASGAAISNLVGATFVNSFDGNASVAGGLPTPIFVNAGVFQKTNGTAIAGATSIDFQFINTGVVEVQTNTLRYVLNQQNAGLTLLDGGGLAAQNQPIQLSGGILGGSGPITLANAQTLSNSASISPGLPLGRLDLTGNYLQTASGTLNIDLGGYVAGTNFDRVTVTAGGGGGLATLGGVLNVALAGSFYPTNGATFTFLTAISRAGAFATFNYPSNDIGMDLVYGATAASVKVTNLKPIVANPVANPEPVIYGATFNFQFPANTFTDPDNDPLTYTASGMPPGVAFTGSTRTFAGTPTQAGVFPVTVVAADGGTPNLKATNTFNITVDPATLTIVAEPQTKTYGAADPALTYTVSGLQLADTSAAVLTGGLARVPGESVAGAPYAISQGTLAANGNYTISFTGNVLAVTPAPLSVTADAKNKIYGALDPVFTASYAGFVNAETPAVLSGTLGFARAPGENAGSYPVTPGGLTSANYAITFTPGALTIAPAPLSITAEAKTKVYGAADPPFTVTYAGFVNGETPAVLGGTLSFTRAPGENAGGYLITPAGLTSSNYSITFHAGTLTVTAAPLTVTADAKTKTYGAADPAFTVSYSGLVDAETSTVLGGTLSFTRAPGENVGGYLITPAGLTSSNYSITFNAGTLTITRALLSVTADAKTKTYGAADPAFTVSYAGLVNGDSPAVLGGTLAFDRAPGENVGNYSITPSSLTNANYTITFNPGTLAITPSPLSVTAEAKTKIYGAADPPFTVTYAGLVNAETPSVLAGTLAFTRGPGENVGSYPVTPGGLSSGNYLITFNPGTLTVTAAPLTVTADAKTKTYGSVDPPFTVAYAGFVNGETPAVLSGTLVLSRVSGETVGSYPITPGGLTSVNYSLSFKTGTLTISRAPLSVTADSKTKAYGTTDPAFTAAYSGFVNGETPAVLGGALSFDRVPGENVGSYAITPGGLTSANYAITFNPGTLAITQVALSITADPKTKTYGDADPAFTVTYAGFVNAENPSVLGGTLTFARGPGENVGSYPVTPSGLTSGNYLIAFNAGTLTITRAPLSITADAKTKTYGDADPTLTVTYAGFVNAENPAVLGGTLSLVRAPGEDVGAYQINPAGLTSANYAITFNTGALTISPAPLSITADNQTKTYGTADPVFTASYAGLVNAETPAVLGGTLSFTRTTGENLGSYTVTPGGVTSMNYAITFKPGTLTILAPAPVILPLSKTGAGDILISWSAVSNAVYRVQFKADLGATTWTDLPGDVTATNNVASRTDIGTGPNRFYRIRVLQ